MHAHLNNNASKNYFYFISLSLCLSHSLLFDNRRQKCDRYTITVSNGGLSDVKNWVPLLASTPGRPAVHHVYHVYQPYDEFV